LSSKLPRDLDGRTLVRALERAGFIVERQSGGHAVLIHPTHPSRELVVLVHPGRPIPSGTLNRILKRAGLTPEELIRLL